MFNAMLDWFASVYPYGDWSLLALRLVIAAIFLVHSHGKHTFWKMQPSPEMSKGMINLMKFISVAEMLGGIAMLFGFLTNLAAVGLGIIMLGAMKMKMFKWKTPFTAHDKTGWELDLLILTACAVIFFLGAGALSLDDYWFGL